MSALSSSVNLILKFHQSHEKPTPLKPNSTASSRLIITNSQKPECQFSSFLSANQSVAAIVLGDGSQQSRLYPLTKRRSEGAIPIGGNYRLIDAVISNCINSNITKIYALTQFNSTSLNSHLSRAYSGGLLAKHELLEVIAAYQSPEDNDWFQGTADAVRRCLWKLEEYPAVDFLVLPGHHLYKMDYQKLMEVHRSKKADLTVAVLDSIRDHETAFGSFKIDHENRVFEFREKPGIMPITPPSVEISAKFNNILHDNFPSMGIYVINRHVMIKLLRESFPKANDLRSEVIPGAISLGLKVHAYRFDGYWEDMRSIEAFYHANMDSTKKTNMKYKHLPPSLATDAMITDSVIGDGCILNRCSIRSTVIGPRTKVGDGAVIEDSVIMGSDTYQGDASQKMNQMSIPIGIGEGSYIKKAIVDKNAKIGKNVKIMNKDNVHEGNNEADGYIIKAGIIVVMRNAVIPDESIL